MTISLWSMFTLGLGLGVVVGALIMLFWAWPDERQ